MKKYILNPIRNVITWVWYYILDPRGLKDFKKNLMLGKVTTTDTLHERTGQLILDKAAKRDKKAAKLLKKLSLIVCDKSHISHTLNANHVCMNPRKLDD